MARCRSFSTTSPSGSRCRRSRSPWGLHERLWPIKYILFLGLFGSSLYSVALAETLAEVEPFKTAIVLKFVRDWPFVIYAATLLVAGLFIERFFCRYLCPLGAALAIPGKISTFEWLRRWPECGSPCQRCAKECPVQAIHPEGYINVNECIYCMHCQELYHDDQRCPHMIQVRLKREKREALSSPSMRPINDGSAGPANRSSLTRESQSRSPSNRVHSRHPDHGFMSEKGDPMAHEDDNNGSAGDSCSARQRPPRRPSAPREASDWHRSSRPRQRRKPARRSPRRVDRRVRNKYEVKPGELDEYYVFFSAARPASSASSACHRCAS